MDELCHFGCVVVVIVVVVVVVVVVLCDCGHCGCVVAVVSHTCWVGPSVAGVEGGAVRVTGARGAAPSGDYKVTDWSSRAFLWTSSMSSPLSTCPGVRYLRGRFQGHGCLSARRPTRRPKGPPDCQQHHRTVCLHSRVLSTPPPVLTPPPSEGFCLHRMQRIFAQVELQDFGCINVQVLGAEDMYGPHARSKVTPPPG